MEFVRETVTEEMISGKKMKVTVRSNRPSKESWKRFIETVARNNIKAEERQKQKEKESR